MDKNTILNYVMNTPRNTNRAVLEGMLEGGTDTGGGSNFIVHAEADTSTSTVVVDKTYNEIVEAINNNIIPVMIATAHGATMVGNLQRFDIGEDYGFFIFQVIDCALASSGEINRITFYIINIDSDNTATLKLGYKNF
jgi:hypothetical protein